MKIEEKISTVEKHGVMKSTEYTWQLDRHAFKMFISGIYSDKPRAIIREVCCNAWDSHIAANKTDKPFSITFPTTFNSQLKIRDYGTGIEPDKFEKIYTTFFMSTKRHSNEFTGGLGIGGKTPHIYADVFNIINFYDGKKYTYVSHINETGKPEVSLLAEEKTSEENGLEVSLDIKPNDYYTFESAIRNVLQFFPVPPVMTGKQVAIVRPTFNFETIEVNGKTYEYTLTPRQSLGIGNGVLMGNVLYPINGTAIPNTGRAHCIFDSLGLKLHIGDVSVVASREGLEYDKKTITLLSDIVKAIYDKLKTGFDDEIKKCKSEYEVKCVCGAYDKTTSGIYGLVFEASWNGKLYNTDYCTFEIPAEYMRDKYPRRINPNKDLYFIVEDSNHRKAAKVNLLSQQHNVKSHVMLRMAEEYIEHNTFMYTGRNLAYKMADDLGIKRDKILFLTDAKLPKAPSTPKSFTITKFEGNKSSQAQLSEVKDGDYVLITYNTIVYDTIKEKKLGHYPSSFISRAIESMPQFKAKSPVYVFNYSDIKYLKKLKVKDFCQEVLEALKKEDVKALKSRKNAKDTIHWEGGKTIIKCIRESSVNKDILNEMDSFKNNTLNSQENALLGFYEKIFGDVALDKEPKDTYTILKAILKKNYPMLQHSVETWKYDAQFKNDVSEYIKLIDNGSKV